MIIFALAVKLEISGPAVIRVPVFFNFTPEFMFFLELKNGVTVNIVAWVK